MKDPERRSPSRPSTAQARRPRPLHQRSAERQRSAGDMPALRRLLEFPKEDAAIVLRYVFDAVLDAAVAGLKPDAPPHFVDCPHCNEPLEAPAPEIQIARLREFQLARAPYWQWSPRRLLLLKELLKPGDVIIRMYAHSCGIRHPNGRVTEYRRTATTGEV